MLMLVADIDTAVPRPKADSSHRSPDMNVKIGLKLEMPIPFKIHLLAHPACSSYFLILFCTASE